MNNMRWKGEEKWTYSASGKAAVQIRKGGSVISNYGLEHRGICELISGDYYLVK